MILNMLDTAHLFGLRHSVPPSSQRSTSNWTTRSTLRRNKAWVLASSALAHCALTPWTHHQGSTAGLLPWPHPCFIFMPGSGSTWTLGFLHGLLFSFGWTSTWSTPMVGFLSWPWSSPWFLVFHMALYLWSIHGLAASGPWSSPWTWSSLRNSVLPQELCMSTLQIWKYKYPDDTECIVSLTPQLVHTSTWTLTSHGFFFSWSSLWPCTHTDLTSTCPSTFIGTWFHTDLGHQARYFRKSSRIGPSSCPGPSASSLDLVHYLLRIKSVTHFGLLIRFQMDL